MLCYSNPSHLFEFLKYVTGLFPYKQIQSTSNISKSKDLFEYTYYYINQSVIIEAVRKMDIKSEPASFILVSSTLVNILTIIRWQGTRRMRWNLENQKLKRRNQRPKINLRSRISNISWFLNIKVNPVSISPYLCVIVVMFSL